MVERKGVTVDIDAVLAADRQYRETLAKAENMRAEKNEASEKITKADNEAQRKKIIGEIRKIDSNHDIIETNLKHLNEKLNALLYEIPNIPFEDAPIGPDDKANVVLRKVGERPDFSFKSKDYMEIASIHDWIDIERAAKVAGTRFGYIKGELVFLELALVRYTLDILLKEGFIPVLPPLMVKPEHMEAMGFLQGEAKDDVYYLEKDNLYLVGTSEQSIGPMHADEIFEEKDLPRRYAGFSTCFRREAGSYGKDTKGILRVHQFDKVEMLSFCHPEKSRDEHQYLLSLNEKMLQEIGLPYRVVHISTGDMGFAKAEQFDIETWIPNEQSFRETHSASNTTDFQARRLRIRYRDQQTKKMEFVHMLNGTAFALGRIMIAIIENYQQKDGSVKVPEILHNYMKVDYIGKK